MSEASSFLGTYSTKNQIAMTASQPVSEALGKISLATKLKQEDSSISAGYYHGLTEGFYNRNKTFHNLGFDNLYFAENQESAIKQYNADRNQSYNWTTSEFYGFIKDSNFIDYNMETFIPATGRFYSHFSTLTTHGTYEARGSNKEYYDILTSPHNKSHYNKMINDLHEQGYYPENMPEYFLYYKAAMLDLDKTVYQIMNRLEETNHLDDTTIVFFTDHNAYYYSLSWHMKNLSTNGHDIEAYHIPCLIYDKKMTDKYREEKNITDTTSTIENDTFMSVLDIYPTVCNILGLSYNTNLCYGQSIFEETPHVFITFKDSGYIFNDEFLYAA
jgi:phosphoglycerol transferase MdoB-like AlkP superfamily enzyme